MSVAVGERGIPEEWARKFNYWNNAQKKLRIGRAPAAEKETWSPRTITLPRLMSSTLQNNQPRDRLYYRKIDQPQFPGMCEKSYRVRGKWWACSRQAQDALAARGMADRVIRITKGQNKRVANTALRGPTIGFTSEQESGQRYNGNQFGGKRVRKGLKRGSLRDAQAIFEKRAGETAGAG